MAISTNEATIQTCTIDVRVMKIGKRQVTLSVFRQLPVRHIIDTRGMNDPGRDYSMSGWPDWTDWQHRGHFPHLPTRGIIPDGCLRGEPWGVVGYRWDGCGYPGSGEHQHIVWEDEGRLYRCCLGRIHFDMGAKDDPLRITEVAGDAVGLHWLENAQLIVLPPMHPAHPYDFCGPAHFIPNGRNDQDRRGRLLSRILWWNELHDRLASLDQLFIAV